LEMKEYFKKKKKLKKLKQFSKVTCNRIRHWPFSMWNLFACKELDSGLPTPSTIRECIFIIAILIKSAADPCKKQLSGQNYY
jgi:hypothetical protein